MPTKFAPFVLKKDLHKLWSQTKKKSEKEAKGDKAAMKEQKALTKVMKSDLGPNLDAWVKAFGDRRAMEKLEGKIADAVKEYGRYLDNAQGKTKDKDRPEYLKVLFDGLDEVEKLFEKDMELARDQLASDVSRAEADSTVMQKKDLRPIPITVSKDIVPLVNKELGKRKVTAVQLSGTLPVEMIIGDTDLLSALYAREENPVILVNTQEAAKLDVIVEDTASAIEALAADVVSGAKTPAAAGKLVVEATDTAIGASLRRAENALEKELKLRGKVRVDRAKKAGSFTLQVVGIVGGVAGIALTPFTGGASTVIGLIGLARSAAALGNEIGKELTSAEEMLAYVEVGLLELTEHYDRIQKDPSQSKNKVGASELAKHTVNAILGSDYVDNLSALSGKADSVPPKIRGIHLKAQKLGAELPKLLDKQKLYETQLADWKKTNATELKKLDGGGLKQLAEFEKVEKKLSTLTHKVITDAIAVQERWMAAEDRSKDIAANLKKLKTRTPGWLVFAEVATSLLAEGGLILSGNLVSGPDIAKWAKPAHTVVENAGRVLDGATQLYEAFNGAQDVFGAKLEKDKAKALR